MSPDAIPPTQRPALSAQSAFVTRLHAFLKERFPIFRYGILIASFYSSNQFLAIALTTPGRPMHYDWGSLLGSMTLLCFFFHLRVFDEHKDFEEDNRNYPERVLQRGIITLRTLKVLGGLAIGLEFLLASLRGIAPLVSVLVAFLFSVLMLKEFFLRHWLKRHVLLYASSHLCITPLLSMVVYSFTTGRHLWQAPGWYWLYSFVGFFVTFTWEISRKIRAPEEEREGVDSYTRIFGTYGAAYAVLALRVIDTGLVALVGLHLGLSALFYGVLIALFGVCLIGFFQYRWQTSPKTARRMETYAGLYIIAFDLVLAIALVRRGP